MALADDNGPDGAGVKSGRGDTNDRAHSMAHTASCAPPSFFGVDGTFCVVSADARGFVCLFSEPISGWAISGPGVGDDPKALGQKSGAGCQGRYLGTDRRVPRERIRRQKTRGNRHDDTSRQKRLVPPRVLPPRHVGLEAPRWTSPVALFASSGVGPSGLEQRCASRHTSCGWRTFFATGTTPLYAWEPTSQRFVTYVRAEEGGFQLLRSGKATDWAVWLVGI